MSPPKGYKPPIRKVPCVWCGTMLERRTNLRKAKCDACQEKHRRALVKGLQDRVRTEARRYRIIMHALGWEHEQFGEMLAEMRCSPMAFRKKAETRVARMDLTIERRRAAWKRRLLEAYGDGVEMADLVDRFHRTPEAIEKMASREGIARPEGMHSRRGSGRAA
jgi:hypothetical protein